jgi:hypothetical protein
MTTVLRVRRSLGLAGCTIGLVAAAAAPNPETNGPKPAIPKTSPEASKPGEPRPSPNIEIRLRRLESLTWNPVTQELTWVLSTGDLNGKNYTPSKQEAYVIHMDSATMSVRGEDRHFDQEEAEQVGKVMDLLCRYVLESTLWWEHGGGKGGSAPGTKTADPDTPRPQERDHGEMKTVKVVSPGLLPGTAPAGVGSTPSAAVGGGNRN